MADETRQRSSSSNSGEKTPKIDLIRQEYKHYKRKKPPPDLSEVIDFENAQTFRGRVSEFNLKKFPHSKFGLYCARQWRVYHLDCCPGLLFIVNPFVPGAQQFWTRKCVEDFPRKPNVSNLDTHMTIGDDQSIWELSQSEWEHKNLIDKLHWVHLGYQFDYNVVDYKPEKYYGFPKDLGGLMQHIAEAIGYPGYTPEAGIVNYYPLGTSMGGHTDHYELDLSWPLVSVSFGQTAIFLIGGKTKDVMPTALYIRSGDILIMSEEARLAFHAVPRIVQVPTKDHVPECLQWCAEMQSAETNRKCSGTFSECTDTNNGKRTYENLNNLAFESHSMVEVPMKDEKSRNGPENLNSEICFSCSCSSSKTEKRAKACTCREYNIRSENTVLLDCKDSVEHCTDMKHIGIACSANEGKCCSTDSFVAGAAPMSEDDWQPFAKYLSKTRININVRQVHSPENTVTTPTRQSPAPTL